MQGPFTRELNVAVMQQFPNSLARHQGWRRGGRLCRESAGRAKSGAQLVVLRRPAEQGETAQEILNYARRAAMKITLIGMGSGCPESLTVQGYAALREADLIWGPAAAVGPA